MPSVYRKRYTNFYECSLLISTSSARTPRQLFSNPPKNFVLPSFEHSFLTQAYDQLAVLGFHLFHPFKLLKQKITSKMNIKRIRNRYVNRDGLKTVGQNPSVTVYGYLITMKATRTSKGEYMYFGTFYDYNFTIFDTVHFPNVAAQYPIREKDLSMYRNYSARIRLPFNK